MRPLWCAGLVLPLAACMSHSPYEMDALSVATSPDGAIVDVLADGDTLYFITGNYQNGGSGSLASTRKEGGDLRTLISHDQHSSDGVPLVATPNTLVQDADRLYIATSGTTNGGNSHGLVVAWRKDGTADPVVLDPSQSIPCCFDVEPDRLIWSASQSQAFGMGAIRWIMNGTTAITEVGFCASPGNCGETNLRPGAVAMAGGFVYVATQSGALYRFPTTATGTVTPELVSQAPGEPLPDKYNQQYLTRNLLIVDGAVYWTSGDEVWTVPVGGPATPQSVGRSNVGWALRMQLVGSDMYWNVEGDDPDQSGVYRARLGDSASTARVFHGNAEAFVVDGDFVYVASDNAPSVIYRVAR